MPILQVERAEYTFIVQPTAMTGCRATVIATIRTACRGDNCGNAVEFEGLIVGTIGGDNHYRAFNRPLDEHENRHSALGQDRYRAACADCGSLMQLLPDTAFVAGVRGSTVAENWVRSGATATAP